MWELVQVAILVTFYVLLIIRMFQKNLTTTILMRTRLLKKEQGRLLINPFAHRFIRNVVTLQVIFAVFANTAHPSVSLIENVFCLPLIQ